MDTLIYWWNVAFDYCFDFVQANWWEVLIAIVVYFIYKKLSRKKSDPTMFKQKRQKKHPHRSLVHTKMYK